MNATQTALVTAAKDRGIPLVTFRQRREAKRLGITLPFPCSRGRAGLLIGEATRAAKAEKVAASSGVSDMTTPSQALVAGDSPTLVASVGEGYGLKASHLEVFRFANQEIRFRLNDECLCCGGDSHPTVDETTPLSDIAALAQALAASESTPGERSEFLETLRGLQIVV